jgi:hypothetical protein
MHSAIAVSQQRHASITGRLRNCGGDSGDACSVPAKGVVGSRRADVDRGGARALAGENRPLVRLFTPEVGPLRCCNLELLLVRLH